MAKTTRTSEGLRNTLFETLDSFLKGDIDAAHAKTVAKIADSLLKSVAIDLEYKRLVEDIGTKRGPQAVASLNLNIEMVKGDQQTTLSNT